MCSALLGRFSPRAGGPCPVPRTRKQVTGLPRQGLGPAGALPGDFLGSSVPSRVCTGPWGWGDGSQGGGWEIQGCLSEAKLSQAERSFCTASGRREASRLLLPELRWGEPRHLGVTFISNRHISKLLPSLCTPAGVGAYTHARSCAHTAPPPALGACAQHWRGRNI